MLDAGAETSAPPQDITLSTSTDGVSWQEAATGSGTGQLTTIDVPATQVRYLRVALSAPATVADVRIYR